MRLDLAIVTVISVVAAFAVNATDVDGLNSARVPVADRSDTEYKRGIAKALEAVIIKMTGSSSAARSKTGRGVVGQAKRLVQQFGYERSRASGGKGGRLFLRVEFDARVLAQEMRTRNLVVWGKERPDTLVWLIFDDTQGRKLLGAGDNHAALRAMQRRARARGIPLVFPVADLGEGSAFANTSSMPEIQQAVRMNADKYGVRSQLIGHLQQATPSLWEVDWVLTVAGEALKWDQQGDIVELLVEEATDSLADALGRRYASSALRGPADAIAVTVAGLHSPQDYARTERYLRNLDSVSNLLVRRVTEQGITFDLTVQGGLLALTQSISFGQMLAPDPVDAATFHLNPR